MSYCSNDDSGFEPTAMEIDQAELDTADDEVKNDVKSPAKRKRGRPKSKFQDLGATQKRTRLDAAFKLCTQLADEMGITMNEVLGNIGKRHYFGSNYDKDFGQMYDRISRNDNPFKDSKMTVEKALFLKESCDMSRENWEQWRDACDGVDIPTRYAMDKLKVELLPKHSKLEAGAKYGLGEALSSTMKRSLESVDFNPDSNPNGKSLIADIQIGFDGQGGNHQFQGQGIDTPTRNIIYGRLLYIQFSLDISNLE